jgi:hypothetical protein
MMSFMRKENDEKCCVILTIAVFEGLMKSKWVRRNNADIDGPCAAGVRRGAQVAGWYVFEGGTARTWGVARYLGATGTSLPAAVLSRARHG